MKITAPNKLALRLREYFTDHLPRVRGMSVHTIHSYRDSLVLFLRFMASQRNRQIHELDLRRFAKVLRRLWWRSGWSYWDWSVRATD